MLYVPPSISVILNLIQNDRGKGDLLFGDDVIVQSLFCFNPYKFRHSFCHSKLDLESHTKPRVTATKDDKHGVPYCSQVPHIKRMLTKFSMRFRVGARNDSYTGVLLLGDVVIM